MKSSYANPWYSPSSGVDPAVYTTDAKPVEYHGFQIFHRIKGVCCDVVYEGVCVAQRVGMSGAREAIERIVAAQKRGKLTREQMTDVARGFRA